MTNRHFVVLFVSIICLLTIGSWADEVRGGQPVTSSLLVRMQSVGESNKFSVSRPNTLNLRRLLQVLTKKLPI